jgi:hypothetical protein
VSCPSGNPDKIFIKVWYYVTVWGFIEGQCVFGEEKTIFGISGHKRNARKNRSRNTKHDKKQSDRRNAIQRPKVDKCDTSCSSSALGQSKISSGHEKSESVQCKKIFQD